MSRQDASRLADILAAIEAINDHLTHGGLQQGIEIGEAVKGIDSALLDTEPSVPWRAIARMRDHLAHRYFDTDHAVVADVVENELSPRPLLSRPSSIEQETADEPDSDHDHPEAHTARRAFS